MENQRTTTQNKALHKYFELLSESLNGYGFDMKHVLKEQVEIDWTPEMVKKYLWKPLQDVMFSKKSTTELTRKEINQVFLTVDKYLGEKLGVELPRFPSNEPEMKA